MIRRYLPLASLMGGTVLGGLLVGAGLIVAWFALAAAEPARTALVLGVGALGAIAVIWTQLRPWLPERPRQLPIAPMLCSLNRAGFTWGVQLGLGVTTFVVTPALYALFAIAVGQATPWATVAICGVYGLCRGAVIAVAAIAHSRTGRIERGPRIGIGLERATRVPTLLAIVAAVALSTT